MEQDSFMVFSDFLASHRLLTLVAFILCIWLIKRFFYCLSSYGALVVIVGAFFAMSHFGIFSSYDPLVGMVFFWVVMRFVRFLANRRRRRWANNQFEQLYEPAARETAEESVRQYFRKAKRGNAEAQCLLADAYRDGKGVEGDYAQAAKWYRKAAGQGYADAQNRLGLCYSRGRGVEQSYEKAAKWYRKAAEQGHAAAQYNLGLRYSDGKGVEQSDEEAAKWYRKSAGQGYADAQNRLGRCYSRGRGVEQSYEEAAKWYRKAAEQGHAAAQYNLGKCYDNGKGVEQSDKEALRWYKKAADQDYADAEFRLVDSNVACHKPNGWLESAARHGHPEANYILGKTQYDLNIKNREKDESEEYFSVHRHFYTAATKGHVAAQYYLGISYSFGRGITPDDRNAFKWFRNAAEKGHAKAQVCLGNAYQYGWGVDKSNAEAVRWYRKAFDQGEMPALWGLISAYTCGDGLVRPHEEAIKCYRIATEKRIPFRTKVGEETQAFLVISPRSKDDKEAQDFLQQEMKKLIPPRAKNGEEAQAFLRRELEKGNAQRDLFTIFGITLGKPCKFPVQEKTHPIASGTHVMELSKPFRHFTEAEVYLTQTQHFVESITLQCRLSPTQAISETLAIKQALEKKFNLSFKDCGKDDKCNHGFHWDTVAYAKGAALYLKSNREGEVILHIEYRNDFFLFIRDQKIFQDDTVSTDLDAL